MRQSLLLDFLLKPVYNGFTVGKLFFYASEQWYSFLVSSFLV